MCLVLSLPDLMLFVLNNKASVARHLVIAAQAVITQPGSRSGCPVGGICSCGWFMRPSLTQSADARGHCSPGCLTGGCCSPGHRGHLRQSVISEHVAVAHAVSGCTQSLLT